MDCPKCKKIVFSGDQFCRHCGVALPPAAAAPASDDMVRSLREAMDGAVAAVDHVWKQAEPHVQRAASETRRAGSVAWNEAQPHIDTAVKAFDNAMRSAASSGPVSKARETTGPAVRAASKSARSAAGRASKVTKPVVADVAEAVEKGARRVKDRARRSADK